VAVAQRSFAFLEAQVPALEHGDVVLVSHEAVNRALLTHLDPALGSALSQPTGCWNEVRRNHDRWTVTLIDQQAALAMDSPGGRPVSGPASSEERPAGDAAAAAPEPQHWLSSGVLGVGGASLFSDSSHELATSLLPTFLTVSLHAGPAALGVIEGTSDALTGFSKLIGGPLADDPRRRGRLASGGYLGTAVATAAIGLTTAVWQVAVLRAFAWISRGIRSPSRDMLLTSLVTKKTYGRAFGIERAGDNAGAILGPVLASVLVGLVGLRYAILLSIVPGVLAAISITLAAREARRAIGERPVRGPCTCNCAGSGAPVWPGAHTHSLLRTGQRRDYVADLAGHRIAHLRWP
jgi:hypothetical protein